MYQYISLRYDEDVQCIMEHPTIPPNTTTTTTTSTYPLGRRIFHFLVLRALPIGQIMPTVCRNIGQCSQRMIPLSDKACNDALGGVMLVQGVAQLLTNRVQRLAEVVGLQHHGIPFLLAITVSLLLLVVVVERMWKFR